MVLKLGTVALVALFSLSPPIEQDTAALKREIEALKAQQAEMQKDLDAIRAYLQQMIVEKAQAAMVNAPISVANAPTRGAGRGQGHDGRGVRLSLPVLPPAHAGDAAADRRGVHQHRQASLRVRRLSDRSAASRRVQGARGRQLRRRAGQVLGDAHQAVRVSRHRATARSSGRCSCRRPSRSASMPAASRRAWTAASIRSP